MQESLFSNVIRGCFAKVATSYGTVVLISYHTVRLPFEVEYKARGNHQLSQAFVLSYLTFLLLTLIV